MQGIHDDHCDVLLIRVASGERGALGELFASEAGRLIAIARRIVRRSDVAEEVVQESFVAAWRNAKSFDPTRGKARGWLTTIVRNRALNVLRGDARLELVGDTALAAFGEGAAEADTAFDRLSEGDALRQCLEKIEPRRRKCVLLAYVVGYSHSEIASELKTPIGTVKAWIRRSTIDLQECLS